MAVGISRSDRQNQQILTQTWGNMATISGLHNLKTVIYLVEKMKRRYNEKKQHNFCAVPVKDT